MASLLSFQSTFIHEKLRNNGKQKAEVYKDILDEVNQKTKGICEEYHIFDDGYIFNMDETGIRLETQERKVLVPKIFRNVKSQGSVIAQFF